MSAMSFKLICKTLMVLPIRKTIGLILFKLELDR